MSPLCKIAWMRDNMPNTFAAAYKFISVKEYVWYKLFDKFEVDYSIASATGLFEIKNRVWCKEALDFCGITEALLSTPVSTLHTQTKLADKYHNELNLPEGILFITGAGGLM